MKDGVYLHDALGQALVPVVAGDYRNEIGMRPGGGPSSPAPIQLILVSDIGRFGGGTQELKYEWGAIDTGIVSQNIALFCAATGMATRLRASISKDWIKSLLKLKDTQCPFF